MTKLRTFGSALLVLAVLAASHVAAAQEGDHSRPEKARLGAQVKDFSVTDSAGNVLRLGTLRGAEGEGKIAVLTFWCSTCGSCRMIERDFDRKATEYGERGVAFLAVASNYTDSPKQVNRLLEKNRLRFRVLMDSDSEIARYFGATFTTTTAVLDAQGRLRYYGGFGAMEAAIKNLQAGEEVAVPERPGSGCAIMLKPQPGDDAARDGAHGGHDDDFASFLARLPERLRLTDEQAAKVEAVLDRLQQETQRLESPSTHDVMGLRHRAIEEIRAMLDDEQRAELEELIGGMRHGHGSGHRGEGQGSEGRGDGHGPRGHDR